MPGETSHTPERLHRFEQEARLAGSLNHPNVLTVFNVGSREGAPYLVSFSKAARSARSSPPARCRPPRYAADVFR